MPGAGSPGLRASVEPAPILGPAIPIMKKGSEGIRMVPGGRVELPTPAFSGPRSTGELPRHREKRRFYGRDANVSTKLG